MTEAEGPTAVILNPASGGGTAATVDGITELFAARGRAAAITLLGDGVSVPEVVRQAIRAGAPAVVAAGGDGTVSAVASALIGGEVPLGILPVGTLNHFAKDLGLPLALEEAVEVVQNGNVRVVDAGEVNGRIFLNNSSIGVYPRLVELRDRYRERGITKWIAAAWAGLAVLRLRPFMGVRIESPEGVLLRRTPFVLVGNNEYHMSGLHPTSRESLTGGKLALYVMKAQGRPEPVAGGMADAEAGGERDPGTRLPLGCGCCGRDAAAKPPGGTRRRGRHPPVTFAVQDTAGSPSGTRSLSGGRVAIDV